MIEPGLFKKTSIVGFEDNRVSDREQVMFEAFRAAREKLRAASSSKEEFEAVNFELNTLPDVYMQGPYEPAKQDELFRDLFRKHLPKKNLDLAMGALDAYLAMLKVTLERDRITADGMLTTGKSGILFIGQMHLKSVARYLSEKCKAQTQMPARGVSAGQTSVAR